MDYSSYNWNTMAQKDAGITADHMFFYADELMKEQKIIEAVVTLERAIQKDPEHGRSYNHLAWIYETKYQDYEKANGLYIKALKYAPEYPPAYLNYAVNLSSLGRYSDLARILKKALAVPGINKSRVHNEYGLMYEQQGKFTNAIKAYKKALLHTLEREDLDVYRGSILRCESKKSVRTDDRPSSAS